MTYSKSAFYDVRRWMLAELYAAGVLTEGDYLSSSPVVPLQQIPEAFDNSSWREAGMPADAPFIVYDIIVPGGYDTAYWNLRDEVVLWIYDYDLDKAFEIKELLVDIFRRLDDSARDINEFLEGTDSPFRFQYFDVYSGLPSDEAKQVLGRMGINIVVTYQYTRQTLPNGRFAL